MALHRTIPDPEDPAKCIHVPLTPAEETAERARWKANADAEAARVKEPTLAERVATLETAVAALRGAVK